LADGESCMQGYSQKERNALRQEKELECAQAHE